MIYFGGIISIQYATTQAPLECFRNSYECLICDHKGLLLVNMYFVLTSTVMKESDAVGVEEATEISDCDTKQHL